MYLIYLSKISGTEQSSQTSEVNNTEEETENSLGDMVTTCINWHVEKINEHFTNWKNGLEMRWEIFTKDPASAVQACSGTYIGMTDWCLDETINILELVLAINPMTWGIRMIGYQMTGVDPIYEGFEKLKAGENMNIKIKILVLE